MTPRSYVQPRFASPRSPDQDAAIPARHPAVVVGAGPVGLTLALDLARRGVKVVLLDEDDTVSVGSRAVCYAKRTLEVWDRMGLAAPLVAKGVGWRKGKVFLRDGLLYEFDLLPEGGHAMPAFINLQQYHLEEALVRAARAEPNLEIRWRHRVAALAPDAAGVSLTVEAPQGDYPLRADWLLACDGARSFIRREMGLPFRGQVFQDRFLIADVRMQAPFPAERWFWFDPPFHPGQSALLHRQADDVWRIDLQLGWDADPEEERKPERVLPRLRAMLGPDAAFELEWVSVYTFQCRRLERFVHGRVLFAGDSAHQVSPFGARGANSGVQDADNLGWKLAAVLRGEAPEELLGSYGAEREEAADENIGHSTRATDFITPKNAWARAFRDAALALAKDHPFARRLVNSGRLSAPTAHAASPLSTPDAPGEFASGPAPGAPCPDAPLDGGFLLRRLGGAGFTLLMFAPDAAAAQAATALGCPVLAVGGPPGLPVPRVEDAEGLAAARFGAAPGACYLVRPDQVVAARRARFEPALFAAALARATGRAAPALETAA